MDKHPRWILLMVIVVLVFSLFIYLRISNGGGLSQRHTIKPADQACTLTLSARWYQKNIYAVQLKIHSKLDGSAQLIYASDSLNVQLIFLPKGQHQQSFEFTWPNDKIALQYLPLDAQQGSVSIHYRFFGQGD